MPVAVRLRLLALVTLCVGMLAGMGLFAAPVTHLRAAPNDPITFSLRQLGYTDQLVTGGQPLVEYYFPDPGAAPGPSQLTFVYSHSPLLLPDFSLVSVEVNAVTVYGARLDDTNSERTRVTINIPAERFVAGPNRITARFELRLREECDGDNSTARAAIVYNDTALSYGPPPNVPPPDLRDFPAQFGSQTRPDAVINDALTALRGSPTVSVPLGVALPPDATAAERSAAGTTMLALGSSRTSLPVEPRALVMNDVLNAARTQNTIIVGRGSSVPADLLRGAPLAVVNGAWQQVGGAAIPADAGILLMVTPPDDPRGRVFIVSGNNDTGITKAATILNTVNTANFLTGQGAIITDVVLPPANAGGPLKLTLQDLGIAGAAATVTGFGSHDITTTFVVPGVINDAATLQIDFASAPTLEPRLSTMTALINDQPFVTQLLDGKNGERRLLTATVPANFFRPGRNTLRFTFGLQGLATVTCRSEISGPAQYATLFPATNLTLPAVSRDLNNLSLALYPFPFATGGDPMTIVVGGPQDANGLATAYRLAMNAGAVAPRGLLTRILTAQEASGAALRGQNAIVVGFPGTNAALAPVADQLFFETTNDQLRLRNAGIAGVQAVGGTAVGAPAGSGAMGSATGTGTAAMGTAPMPGAPASSASPQFSAGGIGPFGVLQLLPAPWDNTRFILVVAGANQDYRALATDALTKTRFGSREAVITKDQMGNLSVGEGRAINMPATLPSVVAVVPTSAAVGAIAIGTPGATGAAGGGAMPLTPAPSVAPSVATAIAGGGIAPLPTAGGMLVPSAAPRPSGTAAPGGTTVAAGMVPGGISLATIPASTGAPTILTPPAAATGAAATVSTPVAGATTGTAVSSPAVPGSVTATAAGIGIIPPVGGAAPTGTRPAGTPAGPVTTPAAGNATVAGTPAAANATIPGVTQVVGNVRPSGTGTVPAANANSVIGNTATQTATAANFGSPVGATAAEGQIFGLPRTVVLGIIAAVVLAIGIVVIALVLQGQRKPAE